jgi:hypothetical protein
MAANCSRKKGDRPYSRNDHPRMASASGPFRQTGTVPFFPKSHKFIKRCRAHAKHRRQALPKGRFGERRDSSL